MGSLEVETQCVGKSCRRARRPSADDRTVTVPASVAGISDAPPEPRFSRSHRSIAIYRGSQETRGARRIEARGVLLFARHAWESSTASA
jgi:hypothetical protein